jgi:peroxiredoxin
MNSDYRISKRTALLLAITVLTMMITNVALVRQNRVLKSSRSGLERGLDLHRGRAVPGFEGLDVAGNRIQVKYNEDQRKTLLLVFSPGCRFCRENMGSWRAIVRALDPTRCRTIAVSLLTPGTKEYLDEYGFIDFPVIAEMDPKARVEYNLTLSPQTIVIDPSGVVEKVWNGLLVEDSIREVESALDMRLTNAKL